MVQESLLDWNDSLDIGVILEQHWMLEEICKKFTNGKRFYCFSIDRLVYVKDINCKRFAFLQSNGSSSTACFVEELIKRGAKKIYRIGTCGSLQKKIEVGDIVLSSSAIRDEGTTYQYVDKKFPAISDLKSLKKISNILNKNNAKTHIGKTWTTDGRFVESKDKILRFSNMNIKSVDMETSTVFVVSSLRKIMGFSLSIVTDKPINDLKSNFKGVIKDLKLVKSISRKKLIDIVNCIKEFESE